MGTPKIGPTGGRDPKTHPSISITSYLPLAPPHSPLPLSLPGPLRTSWDLRKPWEPLEAFGSLGSSVRHRGLAPPHPLTLSCSPCPLSLPGPLEPSWGLRKPWEPLEAFSNLGSSVRLRGLAPPHPPCASSPPEPPWAPGTFLGPQEALEAFGSLGSSVRLRGLASLAPPHPLTPSHFPSPPEPPWAPGTFLGPQQALGAFGSLGQAWVFSQTQRPCFPCSPSPLLAPSCSPSLPEPPWASLGPWDLPRASGSLGRLRKPSAALGLQSDSGTLLPFLPSPPFAPSCSPLLPEPPWAPGTFLEPQEALGAFRSLCQPWVFSQT